MDRIAQLEAQVEAIDQLLLDIDPTTQLFWELNANREACQKTLAILREEVTS